MDICKPKILVTSNSNYIAQCVHCKRIGIFYNNILVGFNLDIFQSFTSDVCSIDFDKYAVCISNENQYLMLKTFHQDIQFAFTKEEFNEFKDMLQQSKIMLEVEIILNE